MMKKSGYAILGALIYGIAESVIYSVYGFEFLTVFFLIIFFSVCFCIIDFNRTVGRNLRFVKVRRELDTDVVKKKDRVRLILTFKNESEIRLYFNYFDTLSDVFSLFGDYKGFISLKPGEIVERRYEIMANSIGKYEVGPVKIFSEDPMRLSYVAYVSTVVDEIKVGPSSSDTFTQRSERLSNFIFTQGIHRSAKAGQGYNFFGVRQYNESDDFRHVAWSKYGIQNGDDLYVKEWEEERQIDVVFLIDYSIGTNIGTTERKLYDSFLSEVINASYIVFKNHDGVGYLLTSSKHNIFIPPSKSSKVVDTLERRVSEIRPDGTFSFSMSAEYIRKNIRKNAMILGLVSPHYAQVDENTKPKDLYTGKQQYYYIMEPRGYFKTSELESINSLSEALYEAESARLKTVSHSLSRMGLNTKVTTEKTMLMQIIADYRTGRMSNIGA